jgi:predicted SnoaL-like aldol condensation-catalyzing enzyme
MADTERNKHAVARLFDAFRVGDTDAFDDLIVDDYVQHDAQAANGLPAAKDYFAPVGPVAVGVHRVIAEGDLAVLVSRPSRSSRVGRRMPSCSGDRLRRRVGSARGGRRADRTPRHRRGRPPHTLRRLL